MFVIAALYQFNPIKDPESLRTKLREFMLKLEIKGTLILALEGINATLCGTRQAIDELKIFLCNEGFNSLEYKESHTLEIPFKRLKVHFKKEIVTLGHMIDPKNSGTYVLPKDWNKLISDPDTICIDVRNDFEAQIGTFKNSINPKTRVFSEFPNFVKENLAKDTHKKIAMSCTGGIRCEKASAFMKEMGFQEVFHLKGGVLKYLEEVPKEE